MFLSIFIALLITTANAASGIIAAKIAIKKENSKFTKIIFGGMVVRYFISAFLIWLCFSIFRENPLPFALTFIISTFIFIFLEILYLNFHTNFVKSIKFRNFES